MDSDWRVFRGSVPQVGELICGKYSITAVLGRGGMGAVLRAVHTVTGKPFALKWLLPEVALSIDGRRRMIREARAASRLKHPAIVEVYDIEEHESGLFLVMELLEGETLHARLRREGPMTAEYACRLLLPCMRGIARAHAVGIVHRDLKPANVFVCAATEETPEFAKILDFGISRVSDEPGGESQVTQSGTILGTPHYMAPEQLQGGPASAVSDVYAFGVLLYEAVSGRLPFEAEALPQLLLHIAFDAPASLQALRPDLDAGFVAVVHRALERDLGRRFSSMSEMVHALEAALRGSPLVPAGERRRRDAGAAPVQRGGRHRRWPLWIGALGVLVISGFAGWELLDLGSSLKAPGQRTTTVAAGLQAEPAGVDGTLVAGASAPVVRGEVAQVVAGHPSSDEAAAVQDPGSRAAEVPAPVVDGARLRREASASGQRPPVAARRPQVRPTPAQATPATGSEPGAAPGPAGVQHPSGEALPALKLQVSDF